MKKGWLKRQADLARKDIKSGMKITKPDRFERMFGKNCMDADDWKACMIPAQRVLTLFRKEHTAVVRMVKELIKSANESSPELDARYIAGHKAASYHILGQLMRRAR